MLLLVFFRFGRKFAYNVSLTGIGVFGILIGYMPYVELYIVMRFITGFFATGVFTTAFVYGKLDILKKCVLPFL